MQQAIVDERVVEFGEVLRYAGRTTPTEFAVLAVNRTAKRFRLAEYLLQSNAEARRYGISETPKGF